LTGLYSSLPAVALALVGLHGIGVWRHLRAVCAGAVFGDWMRAARPTGRRSDARNVVARFFAPSV